MRRYSMHFHDIPSGKCVAKTTWTAIGLDGLMVYMDRRNMLIVHSYLAKYTMLVYNYISRITRGKRDVKMYIIYIYVCVCNINIIKETTFTNHGYLGMIRQ